MTPKNTDKFLKVAPNTGWQLEASGIIDSTVDHFGLVSSTGLPTDTAVLVTVDRVDSSGAKTPAKMERILGIVSENSIINCIRGVEGTPQAHSGGANVEIIISAANFNKWVEALLAEHKQSGIHKGPVTASFSPDADATVTIDLDVSNRNRIQMPAGNITIALSNASVGQIFMIEITQDSVGGRTAALFETIKWAEGTAPTLSGPNKKDTLGFIVTGEGTFDGYIIGQDI